MKPETHFAVSGALGAMVWAASGELVAIPAAIAAGVLPDIDHVLDFYNWYWRRRFDRVLLLLHAWEWSAILAVLSVTAVREPWMVALAAGYFSQVALDQLAYKVHWHTYFLTARAVLRFNSGRVLPNGTPLGSFQSLTRLMPVGRQTADRWFTERLAVPLDRLPNERH